MKNTPSRRDERIAQRHLDRSYQPRLRESSICIGTTMLLPDGTFTVARQCNCDRCIDEKRERSLTGKHKRSQELDRFRGRSKRYIKKLMRYMQDETQRWLEVQRD